MSAVIRIAGKEDALLLSGLGAKTFYDTFATQNTKEDMELYLSKTFTKERLRTELEQPGITFFILEHDGEAVGYAKLRKEENDSMEAERIYMDKNFQGKKLGKMLMEECLSFARGNAYRRVWLGVWEKNLKAIEFYKALGFAIFSEHEFVLGNDVQNDLLMEVYL